MGLSVGDGRFWALEAGTEREQRMTRDNMKTASLVTLDVNNATRYYT